MFPNVRSRSVDLVHHSMTSSRRWRHHNDVICQYEIKWRHYNDIICQYEIRWRHQSIRELFTHNVHLDMLCENVLTWRRTDNGAPDHTPFVYCLVSVSFPQGDSKWPSYWFVITCSFICAFFLTRCFPCQQRERVRDYFVSRHDVIWVEVCLHVWPLNLHVIVIRHGKTNPWLILTLLCPPLPFCHVHSV